MALHSALSMSDEGPTLILAQPSMHLTTVITAATTEAGSHGLRVMCLMEERSMEMDFERKSSVLLSKMILYSRSSSNGFRLRNGQDLSCGLLFFRSPIQR